MTWTIVVASDLAVVGFNPENADLDHPNGERIGEVFFLQATNARGDRRSFGSFESMQAAEDAIESAPAIEDWAVDRPEYGSLAYEAYGQDDDMESERRQNEAESFGLDTRFMIF